MDFLEVKESSRRFSLVFGSAFAAVMVLWSLAVYLAFSAFGSLRSTAPWDPWRLNVSAAILTSVLLLYMLAASIRRLKFIHDGGSSFIATSLGGHPIPPEGGRSGAPGAEREHVLGHVVAEMAVAAQVSEPDVYVLPDEEGINAMAAGLTLDDAAIIITRGALRRLDRDELSAVVAHELSHVLNGDMRRFTLMAGWLHGLFVFQILTRKAALRLTRFETALLGIVMMALGALGYLAGRLIQAAFCRRREMLADATSVQLTRNPKALAGALKKIGGFRRGSLVSASAVSGVSHFFLAKPDKVGLLSSHPPLAERIWALDPSWDGWYHDFEESPVDHIAGPRP